MLVPLAYGIAPLLNLSWKSCVLAASMVLIDNALQPITLCCCYLQVHVVFVWINSIHRDKSRNIGQPSFDILGPIETLTQQMAITACLSNNINMHINRI
ncbi:hypothetical protein BD408DRAFT_70924 [Parasitella parasitica]|nr:hypothetical protein BD408DRAFT_70924 [Parasitella parasitica]